MSLATGGISETPGERTTCLAGQQLEIDHVQTLTGRM